MMDNEQSERLLKQFLTERVPQTIADEGFSSRVRLHLPPSREGWLSAVWTMLCSIAIVVYVLLTPIWSLLRKLFLKEILGCVFFLHKLCWDVFTMFSVYVGALLGLFVLLYIVYPIERRMI